MLKDDTVCNNYVSFNHRIGDDFFTFGIILPLGETRIILQYLYPALLVSLNLLNVFLVSTSIPDP